MRDMLRTVGKAIRDMMEYGSPTPGSSGQALAQLVRVQGAAR